MSNSDTEQANATNPAERAAQEILTRGKPIEHPAELEGNLWSKVTHPDYGANPANLAEQAAPNPAERAAQEILTRGKPIEHPAELEGNLWSKVTHPDYGANPAMLEAQGTVSPAERAAQEMLTGGSHRVEHPADLEIQSPEKPLEWNHPDYGSSTEPLSQKLPDARTSEQIAARAAGAVLG